MYACVRACSAEEIYFITIFAMQWSLFQRWMLASLWRAPCCICMTIEVNVQPGTHISAPQGAVSQLNSESDRSVRSDWWFSLKHVLKLDPLLYTKSSSALKVIEDPFPLHCGSQPITARQTQLPPAACDAINSKSIVQMTQCGVERVVCGFVSSCVLISTLWSSSSPG